jgi:hypothetical protein
MFTLNLCFTFDRLEAIKDELTRVLPEVKSSHRCEALGRGLGFKTYASALTATKSGRVGVSTLCGNRFTNYLTDHGFGASAKSLYEAAAKIALRDIAERTPKLTVWGIGIQRPAPKQGGGWEDARDLNAKFVKARRELIDDSSVEPFLASLAFLARVTPTKTIRSGTGSYWLKHIAENYACTYPDGEELGPTYVPNGVFIAAALHGGFRMKTYVDDHGYDEPNVSFNMSRPGLEDLDCEIRPGGAYAEARRYKRRRASGGVF